jgi:enoyl-CoA hydratase/methylglutaconyl-CoA hydratase
MASQHEPAGEDHAGAGTGELVHLDITDLVATITLDSPHNRNALSRQLMAELRGHLETAESAADARVVLLRSAHRVFCAGADLAEAARGSTVEGPLLLVALQRQIAALPKPVVVELGGPARAGGLGIVAAADVVIAAESVTFALPEVRLGLAPSVISLSLLARLPARPAADLFLSGRTFDAREAARIGLVTRAVADEELTAVARDTVVELAKGNPQGLAETKRLLNEVLIGRIDRDGDAVARRSAELFDSPAAREAISAFLGPGTAPTPSGSAQS